MTAILDFDFARPASYDPTDMVGVACVRSLAAGAHPGTYVGQDGLIKLAPHNLLTYSEQFDNAAWTKNRASISANATADPDGAVTADKLVEDSTTGQHFVSEAYTFSAVEHTAFAHFKAGERSVAVISQASFRANFNLATGTVSETAGSPTSTSIEHVGDGWYLCTMTFTPSAGASTVVYGMCNNGTGFSYAGDGASGLYVWGAQLNYGPAALDYVKTTSAASGGTRIGWGPREPYQNLLLQTTLPGGGSTPTGWTNPSGTGTTSSVSSKFGSAASAYLFTASAARPYFQQSVSLAANTTYTLAVQAEEFVSGSLAISELIGMASVPAGTIVVGYSKDGVSISGATAVAAGSVYSYTISTAGTSGTANVRFGIGVSGANQTASVKLSRPNLNVGAQAYNWYPTTSAPVYTTPFDLVGNWECHGAMSEGMRQNVCPYTNDVSNLAWTNYIQGSGVAPVSTGAYAMAPDGTMTATLVDLDCGGSTISDRCLRRMQYASATIGVPYSGAIWLKAATAGDVGKTVSVHLENAGPTNVIYTLTADWVRVLLNAGSSTATSTSISLYVECRGTYSSQSASVLMWGGQIESGPYASSDIPNPGSGIMSRNADAISYTLSGAHATALSSQGTAVVEYRYAGAGSEVEINNRMVLSIDDGSSANRILVYNQTGYQGMHMVAATVATSSQALPSRTMPAGMLNVAAAKWSAADTNIAHNGALGTKDASSAIPSVTRVAFGNQQSGISQLFGTIKRVRLFSTALTDDQIKFASRTSSPSAGKRRRVGLGLRVGL